MCPRKFSKGWHEGILSKYGGYYLWRVELLKLNFGSKRTCEQFRWGQCRRLSKKFLIKNSAVLQACRKLTITPDLIGLQNRRDFLACFRRTEAKARRARSASHARGEEYFLRALPPRVQLALCTRLSFSSVHLKNTKKNLRLFCRVDLISFKRGHGIHSEKILILIEDKRSMLHK